MDKATPRTPRREPLHKTLQTAEPKPRSEPKQKVVSRPAGGIDIQPKAQIVAGSLFSRTVEQEQNRVARRTDLSNPIEQLLEKRGFFSYIIAVFFGLGSGPKANVFNTVKDEFKKYKDVGVEIPPSILSHFEDSNGTPKSGNVSLLSTEEVETLKELAYLGEQNLRFSKELKERPGIRIKGNLEKDTFKQKAPSEEMLADYCNTLKKLFNEKGWFPSQITEDPNPQVFRFYLGGEPTVVVVKTIQDLAELQKQLELCNEKGDKLNRAVGDPVLSRQEMEAKDPFSFVESRAEKMKIINGLVNLGKDEQNFKDKAAGAIGIETAHVQQNKEERKVLFNEIKNDFNKFVQRNHPENKNFDEAVLSMLSNTIQSKLSKGEVLTREEFKNLQEVTFQAMKHQRYIDDLRKGGVPAEIKGDLWGNIALTKTMPEKSVIEKYLLNLRTELKRGGYPEFIYANPDVTKFEFYNTDGAHVSLRIDTENREQFIAGLASLQESLEACITEAKVLAEAERAKAPQKALAQEPPRLDKKLTAEIEQLRAEVIRARKAESQAEERAIIAQRKGADVSAAALARASAAEADALQSKKESNELKLRLESLGNEVKEMASKYERLETDQKSAQEVAAKQKKMANERTEAEIKRLGDAVTRATHEKLRLEDQLKKIKTSLASTKEGADKTGLEKAALEKKSEIDEAQKAELTQRADLAEAEIGRLKLEMASNTEEITKLRAAQDLLQRQFDSNTQELRNKAAELKAKTMQLEENIAAQKKEIMAEVGESLKSTREQAEKEAELKVQLESLKREKEELEREISERKPLEFQAFVAEYLIEQTSSTFYKTRGHYVTTLLRLGVLSADPVIVEGALKLDDVEVNNADWYGVTPLHLAASGLSFEIVRSLVQRNGIKINRKDIWDNTPLHYATGRAVDPLTSYDIVKELLQASDIDINAINTNGDTPISLAAFENNLDVVNLLLAKEADVNIANKSGDTPLYWAIFHRNVEMVNALLAVEDIKVDAKLLTLAEEAMNITEKTEPALQALKDAKIIFDLIKERNPPAPPGFWETLAKMTDQFGGV